MAPAEQALLHETTSGIPELRTVTAGVIGKLRHVQESAKNLLANHTKIRSRFDQWDSTAYIELMQDERYADPNRLRSLLFQNFVAFADEYTRGELYSTYDFDVIPGVGVFGMSDSYLDTLDTYGTGFAQKLEKNGKTATRADIEAANMRKVNAWAAQTPVQSLFLWHSPPGSEQEGYGGLDGHSFLFVYEKTSETQVVLHQFRLWASLAEHQQIQQHFSPDITTAAHKPKTAHEIIAHTTELLPPDTESNTQSSQEWTTTQLHTIRSLIETTQQYAAKAAELPQPKEDVFIQLRDALFERYFSTVLPLLLEARQYENLSKKDKKRLVQQLDTAFGVLAYQPLLSWVETASDHVDIPQYVATLDKLHAIQDKHDTGQRITREERSFFSLAAPNLLQVTNRTLSMGQCGIGSFLNPSLMSKSFSFNPTVLNSLHSGYKTLTLQNGQSLLVPKEHFAAYKAGSYIGADGIAYGPCGVPLSADNLVRFFGEFDTAHTNAYGGTMSLDAAGTDYPFHAAFKYTITPLELVNNDIYA